MEYSWNIGFRTNNYDWNGHKRQNLTNATRWDVHKMYATPFYILVFVIIWQWNWKSVFNFRGWSCKFQSCIAIVGTWYQTSSQLSPFGNLSSLTCVKTTCLPPTCSCVAKFVLNLPRVRGLLHNFDFNHPVALKWLRIIESCALPDYELPTLISDSYLP